MSKIDEYQANAAECQRMANASRNETDKRRWQEMADHWSSRADQRGHGTTAQTKLETDN
jgi:hypothetical protein